MSGSISFLGARVSSIIDLVRMMILLSLAHSFNHTLFLLSFFLSMTKYFILPNQLLLPKVTVAVGDEKSILAGRDRALEKLETMKNQPKGKEMSNFKGPALLLCSEHSVLKAILDQDFRILFK